MESHRGPQQGLDTTFRRTWDNAISHDEEALLIQGQENNLRKNTSFIERSLYAKRLKDAGMNLTKIAAALGLHRTLIVKQIAVAESIPEDLILAIGPAPDVGRPRWMALVAAIASAPKNGEPKSAHQNSRPLQRTKDFGSCLRVSQ